MGSPGGMPIINGDVTCQNYGVTDIPANTAVLFDTSNPPSGAGVFGVVVPTTSGAVTPVAGITVERIPAGGQGRLRMLGGGVTTASGSITVGDTLQVDSASGKEGRVKTQTSATQQIGLALNSAADGDPITVWIFIAKNA